MNRDDILNMPAGWEINRLVMSTFFSEYDQPAPDFSGDMTSAWFVVEKMRKYINENPEIWDAFIVELGYESMRDLMANISPLAICRAALLVVMEAK